MANRTDARDARLTRYAELRDDGIDTYAAGREVAVSARTASRYERWYRAERGLPAGQPSPSFGSHYSGSAS